MRRLNTSRHFHKFMTSQVNLDSPLNRVGSTSRHPTARAVEAVVGFLLMGQTKGSQLALAMNVGQVKTFSVLPKGSLANTEFPKVGLMRGLANDRS